MQTNLEPILKEHPFFQDLKQEDMDFVVGCAKNVRFAEGEVIYQEGQPVNEFYLIRHGRVAIGIPTTQQKVEVIQTIGEGDILGWSWLIPPYQARFSCKATEDTRAISLDGKCLREKCEKNTDLGFELLKRITKVFTSRLENTRLRLLDMYGVKC